MAGLAPIEDCTMTRTTLNLSDELARRLEQRAAKDGRTREEIIQDVLTAGLSPESITRQGELVAKQLPRIKSRPANPADMKHLSGQAWVDWLKEVELQGEVERHEKALGHQHVDRADS